jgi:hypothetical protein
LQDWVVLLVLVLQRGRVQQVTHWRSCWHLLLLGLLVWVVQLGQGRLQRVWASMLRRLLLQQAWQVRQEEPGCQAVLL